MASASSFTFYLFILFLTDFLVAFVPPIHKLGGNFCCVVFTDIGDLSNYATQYTKIIVPNRT